MACRCSCNSSETAKSLSTVVFGDIRVDLIAFEVDLSADCSDPSGICVNYTATNCDTWWKPKFGSSLIAECSNQFACAQVIAVLHKLKLVTRINGWLEKGKKG